MANNANINKVVYGGSTLIDLTGDTVAADKLLAGYTAHDASGAAITGTAAAENLKIRVTAPTGSTVTAAKDGKTYVGTEDANNPGNYTVSVPEYGTYTVTATLGTWNDSESLLLEKPEVEMFPWEQLVNYTMLYDGTLGEAGADGANVCKDVTGGWENGNITNIKLTFSLAASYVSASGTPNGGLVGPVTTNQVSLEGYSRLFAKADFIVTALNTRSGGGYYTPTARIRGGTTYDTRYGKNYIERPFAISYTEELPTSTQTASRKLAVNISSNVAAASYITIDTGDSYSGASKLYSMALAKTDDWETLCTLADVTVPETMDALLADGKSLTPILNNRAAVEFMVKQCTGTFMVTAVTSDTFLSAYQASRWKTVIDANAHWSKFLGIVA